jgi:hypothetical protein
MKITPKTVNRKVVLRFLVVTIFIVVAIVSIYGGIKVYTFFNPLTELETISPEKTYSLAMKERPDETDGQITHVKIRRNDEAIVDDDIFFSYSGGCFLCQVGQDYTWLSENILRFGDEVYPDDIKETLTLKNHSSKSIRWLCIKAYSYFLIFDMKPGDEVSFTTSTRNPTLGTPLPYNLRSDFKGMRSGNIKIWGKFTDDSRIKGSAYFKTVETGVKPNTQYRAVITDETTDITSDNYKIDTE